MRLPMPHGVDWDERFRDRSGISSSCVTSTDSATTETGAARPQQSGDCRQQMHQQNGEIAHGSIMPPRKIKKCPEIYQFALEQYVRQPTMRLSNFPQAISRKRDRHSSILHRVATLAEDRACCFAFLSPRRRRLNQPR